MRFEEIEKKINKTDKRGAAIEKLISDRLKPGELVRHHLSPCGDDLVLITLKGHLIIEHLLELNLARLLGLEDLPKKRGRLNFGHKLKLLQAVLEQREPDAFHKAPNADLLCAIEKLNEVRNQFAHKLKNPAEIKAEITDFLSEYRRRSDVKSVTDTTPDQLKKCIGELCTFLDRVRVHFYKLQLADED